MEHNLFCRQGPQTPLLFSRGGAKNSRSVFLFPVWFPFDADASV